MRKMSKRRTCNFDIGKHLSDFSLAILLVSLVIVFSIWTPNFLVRVNITNILVQNVHIAVCMTGVLIIMISGGCDLSIGYQISCVAVLMTKLITEYQVNSVIAIILGVLLGALLGLFNGFIAQKLKSHPMMVTLGTMSIFQGVSYLMSNSKTYFNLPTTYKVLGQYRIGGWLPLNVIVMVLILVVVWVLLEKTCFGRNIYSVGDNPEASRLAGLNVNKIKIMAFVIAGVLVGISAVLLSSRTGSADSTTGPGLEITGITACVLGGVALKGGEGKLWRCIFAVYVLGVLSNGMQLVGLGVYPQYIAKGVIMLTSIYLSNRKKKTA